MIRRFPICSLLPLPKYIIYNRKIRISPVHFKKNRRCAALFRQKILRRFAAPGVNPTEVTVDGEVVLANGAPTRVDADEIRVRAAEEATRLHHRLADL